MEESCELENLMNWRIFVLNVEKLSELPRLGSSRFHVFAISRGKEWVFQKILFYEDGNVVYCLCSIWHTAQRNLMKTVFKITDFENFVERQSFLYQHQSRRDAKPNFWYSFSVFFFFYLIFFFQVAPIIARKVLYWTDPSLSWKWLLNTLLYYLE